MLVHCLLDLAIRPEYVQPLREEVQTVWNRDNHQWTKEGLESMEKLDSFVKECQRFNPLDAGQ